MQALYALNFLIVENGDPYTPGERLELFSQDITLGRASKGQNPTIAFSSPYISRQHALISNKKGLYYLTDLASTHGTELNGLLIEPHLPYELKAGDRLVLAQGAAMLTYGQEQDLEKTISLPIVKADSFSLYVDHDKKLIWAKGELLNISGKTRDLLLLLYQHKNKAVSYEEIKITLWSERKNSLGAIPEVGNEEINALVYRLRKNLGEELGAKIVTVSRYGLILSE